VNLLRELDHPNVIKCFGGWRNAATGEINFITELFTSGSLREYMKKHQDMDIVYSVKRWGHDILSGLQYLHLHNPPIIHRDLKCDNVFVNGHTGQVKIADLGVATIRDLQKNSGKMTVIGTPEFMAPELYDENYDQQVDIYAFGMVLLEITTGRFPYDECKNQVQIWKAVSRGDPPAALHDVQDAEVKAIIEACSHMDPDKRPKSNELLENQFFQRPKLRFNVQEATIDGDKVNFHFQFLDADGANLKRIKFDFDLVDDEMEEVVEELKELEELLDADPPIHMSDHECAEVVALLDDRVKALTVREGRYSKMKTHLVRVPTTEGTNGAPRDQSPSIKVQLSKNSPNELRVEMCMKDRKGLLWEIMSSLQGLPIDVKNASINTHKDGMALDVFEVEIQEGSVLRPEELERILRNVVEG